MVQGDALANDGGGRFKVVLTNPPFGKKSSYKVVGEDGWEYPKLCVSDLAHAVFRYVHASKRPANIMAS